MSWGGTQINLRKGQITRANYSQGAPVDTFVVRLANQAILPFNLVILDGSQTPANKYVINATAGYGAANNESFIFVAEPRLFRPSADEFFDYDTAYGTMESINASLCVEKEIYVVRASSNAQFAIGDAVIPAADGTVGKPAAGVNRAHCFAVIAAKTTTATDRFLLVRYLGITSVPAPA